MPDLKGRACANAGGQKAMDAAIDSNYPKIRQAAQAYCGVCPVRAQCLAWALRDEQPPGNWPGVYGGMTSLERAAAYGPLDDGQRASLAEGLVSGAASA